MQRILLTVAKGLKGAGKRSQRKKRRKKKADVLTKGRGWAEEGSRGKENSV